jgi:hypothetical protein
MVEGVNMPCICEEPEVSWENHLEMMLEKSCRYLTEKQILSINGGNNGWIGAYEWYRTHLMNDFHVNYENDELREFYQKEAHRLGWKLNKIDGGVEII